MKTVVKTGTVEHCRAYVDGWALCTPGRNNTTLVVEQGEEDEEGWIWL
jgi:hypothetical protein